MIYIYIEYIVSTCEIHHCATRIVYMIAQCTSEIDYIGEVVSIQNCINNNQNNLFFLNI